MNSYVNFGRRGSNSKRLVRKCRAIDLILSVCATLAVFFVYKKYIKPSSSTSHGVKLVREDKFTMNDGNEYVYNRKMPLIFVGGVPRSGTTLMRAMLDAHPDVRCGQETRVIPRMLQYYSHWLSSEKESSRLKEAGIDKKVLENAVAQFCLEIIANHGEGAKRLCNKDPLTLKKGVLVSELFPNMKFIFMVRDGRATVHSIVSRKITITGFSLQDYHKNIIKWNSMMKSMYAQCELLGSKKCLPVHYEKLVLKPKETMEEVLNFLDLSWSENVMHHEDFFNRTHGIALSKVERSSDQVINPVNQEAMTKWVGVIPKDVIQQMASIAPMLEVMGYDPYENPPNYSTSQFKINHEYAGKHKRVKNIKHRADDYKDYE